MSKQVKQPKREEGRPALTIHAISKDVMIDLFMYVLCETFETNEKKSFMLLPLVCTYWRYIYEGFQAKVGVLRMLNTPEQRRRTIQLLIHSHFQRGVIKMILFGDTPKGKPKRVTGNALLCEEKKDSSCLFRFYSLSSQIMKNLVGNPLATMEEGLAETQRIIFNMVVNLGMKKKPVVLYINGDDGKKIHPALSHFLGKVFSRKKTWRKGSADYVFMSPNLTKLENPLCDFYEISTSKFDEEKGPRNGDNIYTIPTNAAERGWPMTNKFLEDLVKFFKEQSDKQTL